MSFLLPIFLLSILLGLPPSGAADPFVCAGRPPYRQGGRPKVADLPSTGSRTALVIFAQFKGEGPKDEPAPDYAAELFDPNRPGSVSHFYREMSFGALQLSGVALPKRYTSDREAAAYAQIDPETRMGGFGRFNEEIFAKVDREIDFGALDNDGPDGRPDSGDDDGLVDFIFVVLKSAPKDFFIGTATGFASLGLSDDFVTDDPAAGEGRIRIPGEFTAQGGTTQRGTNFTLIASTICHEFGHTLGLPDLFDQSFLVVPDQDLRDDSAGVGAWDLMGRGALGWNGDDGPNPFSAWSRAQLGWTKVVEVTGTMRGVSIEDAEMGGAIYKLPVGDREYFLVENRQRSGGYYDRNIPGEGLLIYHVDERADDNDEERHKLLDVESADGLFTDGRPDPAAGEDHLDRWARDVDFARRNGGSLGDAGDPFDGLRATAFGPETNPDTDAYTGLAQRAPTGVAIRNIRRDGVRMVADFVVGEEVPGLIASDQTWAGTVEVPGDAVVALRATLTIARGTVVRFAPRDGRAAGVDTARCELTVYGGLRVEGTPAQPVRFTSAASPPRPGDWYGIRLLGARGADLSGALVEGAQAGVVRTEVAGGATWSGQVLISEDVVVPEGATLTLTPGTTVRFAEADQGGSGFDPGRCELIVRGSLAAKGTSASPVIFTSTGAFSRNLNPWYGIRPEGRGARLEMDFCIITLSAFGINGRVVGPDAAVTVDHSAIRQNASTGINLELKGGATLNVSNTTIELHNNDAIHVEGSGSVLLRNTVVQRNGGSGLFLGNCDLQAVKCTFQENGVVPPSRTEAKPTSGIKAAAGSSRSLVLWDCTVSRSGADGLDLGLWRGRVEIHNGAVRDNAGRGLYASGAKVVTLESPGILNNGSSGAVVEKGLVEAWTADLQGNGGPGLVLSVGASGLVEGGQFSDKIGVEVADASDLLLRGATFQGADVALISRSSSPEITRCTFSKNIVAVRIAGRAVPSTITQNSFLENGLSVENQTSTEVKAEDNWWGTADPEAIARQVKGPVDWQPFLTREPGPSPTTVEMEMMEGGATYALGQAYPNPFNQETAIAFQVPPSASGPDPRPYVTLTIYNTAGQPIRRLLAGRVAPGLHRVVWDGSDDGGRPVASGVYLYRMASGDFVRVRKLALVR